MTNKSGDDTNNSGTTPNKGNITPKKGDQVLISPFKINDKYYDNIEAMFIRMGNENKPEEKGRIMVMMDIHIYAIHAERVVFLEDKNKTNRNK